MANIGFTALIKSKGYNQKALQKKPEFRLLCLKAL